MKKFFLLTVGTFCFFNLNSLLAQETTLNLDQKKAYYVKLFDPGPPDYALILQKEFDLQMGTYFGNWVFAEFLTVEEARKVRKHPIVESVVFMPPFAKAKQIIDRINKFPPSDHCNPQKTGPNGECNIKMTLLPGLTRPEVDVFLKYLKDIYGVTPTRIQYPQAKHHVTDVYVRMNPEEVAELSLRREFYWANLDSSP